MTGSKWNVPEEYNFGFDVLDERARKTPDKAALVSVDNSGDTAREHTFRELSELSDRFANGLLNLGVQKGERVLLFSHRIPEWYVAVLASIKIGAVIVPTPNLSTPRDLEYMVKKAEPSVIVTDHINRKKVDEIREEMDRVKYLISVNGEEEDHLSYEEVIRDTSNILEKDDVVTTKRDDPMLIFFTSGTTGMPKMTLHTHDYPIAQIAMARFIHDLKKTDTVWAMADNGIPKFFYGKLFGQWMMGAAVLQHNLTERFDPERVLKILEDYGIDIFCVPPIIYKMLLREDIQRYDLDHVRRFVAAGEPLLPDLLKRWKKRTGKPIHEFYGQSETAPLVANYLDIDIKPGSMGKAMPGYEIEIIDDEGRIKPAGEEGHIGVRIEPEKPPGIFEGYWKDEDRTEKIFRHGWYYTMDRAYKDEDGYFWFVGREDDMIKASGYRIGPFEVESALEEHPAVRESAVIGAPDERRGKVVMAYIVLNEDIDGNDKMKEELQDHVKRITAPYKYPREIEFVDELPITGSGKVKRAVLRDRVEREYLTTHERLPY